LLWSILIVAAFAALMWGAVSVVFWRLDVGHARRFELNKAKRDNPATVRFIGLLGRFVWDFHEQRWVNSATGTVVYELDMARMKEEYEVDEEYGVQYLVEW
jgi:hypothetical protein